MLSGCRPAVGDWTVAAGFARGLIDFAAASGAERAELAARSGLDPAALEDQDRRIPFATYVALMRAAKALTGDPALALHFGEAVDISEMSIIGLLGQACATAMEAFAQVNRFARLSVDVDLGGVDRLGLEPRGEGLWLVDHRPDPNDFPELTESSFARMVSSGRRFGVETPALEVHVTHAEPPHHAEYDRIFQVPVRFESDWNAIRIDPSMMALPIARQPRYVFGILSEHAEALLRELESSKTIRGRIESLLMPVLHTGQANIETIAARLGLSRQTLYRRLKAEGVTFETILDELRRELALRYLRGRKVSINETAYLVGFSDRAAFSRAFKRWTGSGPGAVRR
jgi:AraC-like DNA-binding protein